MVSHGIVQLSALDQIMPRLYLRWLLCFPLSKTAPAPESIVNAFQSGINSTLIQMPILSGHLVPESSDPSRLEVHIPAIRQEFRLKVKRLDVENGELMPPYESLKEINFPVSKLPDKLFTPPDEPTMPVFDTMASFIQGGLLLCIKCHHAVVDGGGLGLVVKLLAQHCHAQFIVSPFPPMSQVPSVDRRELPANVKERLVKDVGFSVAENSRKTTTAAKEYESMTSHIYKFSSRALQELKRLCSHGSVTTSSHDALTALLYGAVSYARALRLTSTSPGKANLASTMGIAVNGRNRLNHSVSGYAGNVTLYATFSTFLQLPCAPILENAMTDLTNLSKRLGLPYLAAQTHTAVAAVNHDYITSTISLAESLDDISGMKPLFSDFYQGKDFFITSGAEFPVFDQEWWPGGTVDALRIPLKAQWDGSCAVLATRDRSEGLDILLGLREDDMSVVKDILFAFGAYIL